MIKTASHLKSGKNSLLHTGKPNVKNYTAQISEKKSLYNLVTEKCFLAMIRNSEAIGEH